MNRNAPFFQVFVLLSFLVSAGCSESSQSDSFLFQPDVHWSGTTSPCVKDDECVKVPHFFGGCGHPSGSVVAIHREEVETYKNKYLEFLKYQKTRESTVHALIASIDKTCGFKVMARCRDARCQLVDELGDEDKKKIGRYRRSNYLPSEYEGLTGKLLRRCARDEDCVQVPTGRCDGKHESINREYEKFFSDLRYRNILRIDCGQDPSQLTSEPQMVPMCEHGQCLLGR